MLIEAREALKRLCDECHPLEPTEVALADALGSALAQDVAADRDSPPTDRSAMDGYAVRAADVRKTGAVLTVVGELRAGAAVGALRVEPGQAVRIMTGAAVPPGADAVVMVENTHEDRERGLVTVHDAPPAGQHIRRRGEDVEQGATVLEAGAVIQAAECAVLAAVGLTRPRVYRLPIVHLLSTGDEVVEPEATPLAHQVRNSNAVTLAAQLHEMGLACRYLGIARDDRGRLEELLAAGFAADLLLVTGGVSAGDYDLVGEVLAEHDTRVLFHGVAVKPGKPILAGRRGSTLIVGLPGNPVSAYTGFAVFVAPALRRMMGYRHWRNLELQATLERPLKAAPNRQTYHLARIDATREGLTATPVVSHGSGDVVSLGRANGFVVTSPGGGDLAAGTRVTAVAWRDFHLR